MTNALISTIVAAAATFLAAGLVIQFAVGSSKAAQQELRGGVQIDNEYAFYQLIIYDSLIAYQCDSSAGGNLDATGDNDWASWRTYKRAADASSDDDPPEATPPDYETPGGSGGFRFNELNSSFRGDELKCYGTETSIGGMGVYEAVHPSSREWRNDQEGEHSRIRWTVNSSHPIKLDECLWFDQPSNLNFPANPLPGSDPAKGWGEGGITDMVYFMVDNRVNSAHDMYDTGDYSDENCFRYYADIGPMNKIGGKSGDFHGNFFTVNFVSDDGPATYTKIWQSGSSDFKPAAQLEIANQIRGPDTWADRPSDAIDPKNFKLCPGARGYIQTNTGWTDNNPNTKTGTETVYNDKNQKDYMDAAPYTPDKLPGNADKEKYSTQDDTEDNSVHPIIVIEDKGTC